MASRTPPPRLSARYRSCRSGWPCRAPPRLTASNICAGRLVVSRSSPRTPCPPASGCRGVPIVDGPRSAAISAWPGYRLMSTSVCSTASTAPCRSRTMADARRRRLRRLVQLVDMVAWPARTWPVRAGPPPPAQVGAVHRFSPALRSAAPWRNRTISALRAAGCPGTLAPISGRSIRRGWSALQPLIEACERDSTRWPASSTWRIRPRRRCTAMSLPLRISCTCGR